MYIDDWCHNCEGVFVCGVSKGSLEGVRKIEEPDVDNPEIDSKSCTYHAMTNGELDTWSLLPDQ
jgi:hypothetical protein